MAHLYQPAVITYFVKEVDIFDTRVIDYMEEHDSFKLLETKIMDRVIRQMWEGSLDTGGSFFALSTCFNLLRKAAPSYPNDYERTHRFRLQRDLSRKRHHPCTFRVYLKSKSLRYKIELLMIIAVMAIFMVGIMRWISVMMSFVETQEAWTILYEKLGRGTITPSEKLELDKMNKEGFKRVVVGSKSIFLAFVGVWLSAMFTVQSICVVVLGTLTGRRFRLSLKLFVDTLLLCFAIWCAIIYY